jgi:5-methylthioadenosine/S-adenosylhomocysteine deaminase
MQMGFGRPLTNRLLARGAPLSVGSDVESAMSADMFTVTRFALKAARFVESLDMINKTGQAPASMPIGTVDALNWAIVNGARIAGLDRKIGSLTPGKQADLVMLRTSDPYIGPIHAPTASIVLQAGRQSVDTVMIAGEFRKRAGRLLTGKLDRLRAELEESGRRILAAVRSAPSH